MPKTLTTAQNILLTHACFKQGDATFSRRLWRSSGSTQVKVLKDYGAVMKTGLSFGARTLYGSAEFRAYANAQEGTPCPGLLSCSGHSHTEKAKGESMRVASFS